MKCLVMLLGVAAVSSLTVDYRSVDLTEWEDYKLKHGKEYESLQEERDRMAIYAKNKIMVAQHNERYSQNLTSFSVALNGFSDWFPSEIQLLNGYKSSSKADVKGQMYTCSYNSTLPDYFNWKEKGAVTPVKNLGKCGSCWAFSATGALEGQYFMQTGDLVSLSEQNLVDCPCIVGNSGCNGGTADLAFKYVAQNGGIEFEDKYPYAGRNLLCGYEPKYSEVTAFGFVELDGVDEECLQEALLNNGPLAVMVYAEHPTFIKYNGGVYYDEGCTSTITTHPVRFCSWDTAYGTNMENVEYWLIKNSWGHW